MIDPAFRSRVEAALATLEREESVQVLLAIESGSRAWGFPSRDSDYDVRFLFVRPLVDYLRVVPARDVIERPIDGALDLSGWDARKALGLAVRSNAVIGEWLASPLIYRADPAPVAALRALVRTAAHVPALAYHYDRLARGAWTSGTEDIRIKSYCYALRPALALCWLREHGTPPPMDMAALLAGVPVPDAVEQAIGDLLLRKLDAAEADRTARDPVLERFLAASLADPAPRATAWDREGVGAEADALFARLVRDGAQGAM